MTDRIIAKADMMRFMEKVFPEPNSGCWLWDASVNMDGYGHFSFKGKILQAHRWIYEQVRGNIPSGLQIDHLCQVKCCVNPDHMEVVTHKENIRRAIISGSYERKDNRKIHCYRGHKFTPENTIYFKRVGETLLRRSCKTCKQTRGSAYRSIPKTAQIINKELYDGR